MFELRLVDLAAQQAAEAALAAAIASASSALTLAPIPPHLRLGAGAKHSRSRPLSAPAASARTALAAAGAASTDAAAAGGVLGGGAGAGGGSGRNTGSGGSAGGLAAGLSMLQSSLADLPTLGSEGVLASVRVKDGRLVGTQGLARELRKQHGTRVPYKVKGTAGRAQSLLVHIITQCIAALRTSMLLGQIDIAAGCCLQHPASGRQLPSGSLVVDKAQGRQAGRQSTFAFAGNRAPLKEATYHLVAAVACKPLLPAESGLVAAAQALLPGWQLTSVLL